MSLRNPRILCHPFELGPLRPGDQVIDLELGNELFAPGAESYGRLSFNENPNLSHDTVALIENFLGLGMAAHCLSKLPSDRRQLNNVRLMAYGVIAPATWAKMKEMKTDNPSKLIDKNFVAQGLRIVASSKRTEPLQPGDVGWTIEDPWGHSFGNIQKAINTQAERLKLKEDKQAKTPNKKKGKRRRGDDDEEDEPPAPVETIHQKWERLKHLGVWERAQLPVFQNPMIRGAKPNQEPPYAYIHKASESQYFHMVDKYRYTSNLPHDGDISDTHNPYNPINVFSPVGNFLRRVDRLLKDPVYAGKRTEIKEDVNDPEKTQKRRQRVTASLQEEIKFDCCFETDGLPLSVPYGEGSEFRSEGITRLKSCYSGELCWLLDIEDFTPETWKNRSFPWACRTAESKGASREQRVYVRGAPLIDNIPRFLLPDGIDNPQDLLMPGERVQEENMLVSEDDLKTHYDHTVNMKPTMGLGGMTMARWGEENLARKQRMMDEVREQETKHFKGWREDSQMAIAFLDLQRELRRRMQLECIDEFKAKIHSSEITASKARRSIAKWYNDRCSQAEESGKPMLMSFPRDHVHHNLSVLADAVVGEMESLDSLFLMHQGHKAALCKLISALQVHIPFHTARGNRPTNIHSSFLTQSTLGSIGKSFVDNVVMWLLIVGSYMKSDLITPQFLTGSDAPPDDDNFIQTYHKMLFFMDELQNGLLEQKDTGKSTPASQGSSSIAEMIKTVITKGMYSWIGPLLDKTNNTAWRANGEIKVYAEIVFLFNTNKSLMNYTHSTLSRFIVEFAKGFVERPNGTITDKIAQEAHLSPQALEKKKQMGLKWNRNQLVASVEGQLIEGSVHELGIDTTCADQVWKWTQQRGSEYHLTDGFSLARNFDIYRSLVQGWVLYELNVKMFDIVGAPFARRPWTFQDAMWFEPHLVSTTEHATLAFGMMRSAFENEGLILTTRLLYTWAADVQAQSEAREVQAPQQLDDFGKPLKNAKPIPDLFHFKEEIQKDKSSCFSIVIENPSVFTTAGGSHKNQLIRQLASKLVALKSQHPWAYQLTEDMIFHSVAEMLTTNVKTPFWHFDYTTSEHEKTTRTRGTEQLRLEPHCITIPSVMWDMGQELLRVSEMKASLKSALQSVLQHKHNSRNRDILYGDVIPDLPHLLDVIKVGKGDAQLLVKNPSTGQEEPLTEDIDDYFLRHFDAKLDVGKYMQRAYPSNNPQTLREQVFLCQPSYDLRAPYPTHDPLFFPEQFKERKALQLMRIEKQNGVKKRKLHKLTASQPPGIARETELQLEVLERALKAPRMLTGPGSSKSLCGMTEQTRRLIKEPDMSNDLVAEAAKWLQEDHTKPIHPYIIKLANPTRLDGNRLRRRPQKKPRAPDPHHYPLPPGLQHPLTSASLHHELADVRERVYNNYHDHVKTTNDITVDIGKSTLVIDNSSYKVYNTQLQLSSAPDPYNEEMMDNLIDD